MRLKSDGSVFHCRHCPIYVTYGTPDRQLQAHAFPNHRGRTVPEKEMIMNCHYIEMQLERIRDAG
ncbi:MAG TPA: hypothetical protein VI010_13270, partial [Xanthobacteraceae bacterium]